MYELTEQKLNDVTGGGRILIYVLGAAASFLAGVITGWFNPKACNK